MIRKNLYFVKKLRLFISRNYIIKTLLLILFFTSLHSVLYADETHKFEVHLQEKIHGHGFLSERNGKKFLVSVQKSAAWQNATDNVSIRELEKGGNSLAVSTPLLSIEKLIPTERGFFILGTRDSVYAMYYAYSSGLGKSVNLTQYGLDINDLQTKGYGNGCLFRTRNDKALLIDTHCHTRRICNDIFYVDESDVNKGVICRNGHVVQYMSDSLSVRLPLFEYYGILKRQNGNIAIYMSNSFSSVIQSVEYSAVGKLITTSQIRTTKIYSAFLQHKGNALSWLTYNEGSTYLCTLSESEKNIRIVTIENDALAEDMFLYPFTDGKNLVWSYNKLLSVGNSKEMEWQTIRMQEPDITYAGSFIAVSHNNNLYFLEYEYNALWWFYYSLNEYGETVIISFAALFLLLVFYSYLKNDRIMSVLLDKNGEVGIAFINRNGIIEELNKKAQEYFQGNFTKNKLSDILHSIAPELAVKLETIVMERRSGTGVFPISYRGDIKDYSVEWIPIFSWLGRLQIIILRITDLTNVLEKRRMLDWAHLAHDMQTNLSVIRLSAEGLPSEDYEISRQKNKILHQANILLRRVRDIMTIARERKAEFLKISSEEICRRVIEELDTGSLYTISVKKDISSVVFDAEPEKLIRGIMNAAQNSIKAMAGTEGMLTIGTYYDNVNVYFTVKDTGVGMDEETRKNMFVPFFTTSRRGGGSGIGTMVMLKIVSDHKGTIKVDSELGVGTTITIIIPRKQKQ